MKIPKPIPEWKRAWRMFSVQLMALVLAWVSLPEAQQAAMLSLLGVEPDAVTALLAFLALVGRLIDQPALHQGERQ